MPDFFAKLKASTVVLAFFIFTSSNCFAETEKPLLAIIFDDIGDHFHNGKQAIELDADFTYALLPFSPHAKKLAQLGQKHNKEFMLHVPMQSIDSRLHNDHTLHMHMTHQTFKKTLSQHIKQFPFIKGINNHMGSLLTRHAGYMELFMQEIRQNGSYYFVDSRTTHQTVALKIARENNIPAVERDIFLDSHKDQRFVNKQLSSAINVAKEQGYAIAIAHPYKETLSVLNKQLSTLKENVKLVSVSTVIRHITESSDEKSTGALSAGL